MYLKFEHKKEFFMAIIDRYVVENFDDLIRSMGCVVF